jgi:hypothetical protein
MSERTIARHGYTEPWKGWKEKNPIAAILHWEAQENRHRQSLCEFVEENPRLAPTRGTHRNERIVSPVAPTCRPATPLTSHENI